MTNYVWFLRCGLSLPFFWPVPDRNFSLCSPITLFLIFLFQMICSTVQKASPQRFSASTCLPWRGTQRTSSEQNFAPCGCQTQMPRGTNSELSSTRCVKVPFPCPFTEMRWKLSGEEPQRSIREHIQKNDRVLLRSSREKMSQSDCCCFADCEAKWTH